MIFNYEKSCWTKVSDQTFYNVERSAEYVLEGLNVEDCAAGADGCARRIRRSTRIVEFEGRSPRVGKRRARLHLAFAGRRFSQPEGLSRKVGGALFLPQGSDSRLHARSPQLSGRSGEIRCAGFGDSGRERGQRGIAQEVLCQRRVEFQTIGGHRRESEQAIWFTHRPGRGEIRVAAYVSDRSQWEDRESVYECRPRRA